MKRKAVIILAVGLLLSALSVSAALTAPSAKAALGIQICSVGQVKCFNGWGGGSDVKTYDPGVFNDNFVLDFVSGRCASGSDLTTANCPFSGVPAGLSIVQVKETYVDNGNNECIGDYQDLSGRADAESFDVCNNDQTGFGGDYGTIFVVYPTGCGTNVGGLLNSHWSTNFGSGVRGIGSDFSSNGNQFYLNVASIFCYAESNF